MLFVRVLIQHFFICVHGLFLSNDKINNKIFLSAYLFWVGNDYFTRTLAIILLLGLLFSGLDYFNKKFFDKN